MKILFVTQTAAINGGIERWLSSLSTGLAASGLDITIALVDGPAFHNARAYLAAFPELNSLRHVIIRSKSGTSRGRLRGLENAIREAQPDIVIPVLVHETLEAVQRCKEAGDAVKLVYPLHENEIWAFDAVAQVSSMIDAVVSVNALMLQALHAWAGWPVDRSFHIRAGVDVPVNLRGFRERPNRLIIGYCGKLIDDQKRAGDLVSFCRELDTLKCNYQLRIAGDGPQRATLTADLAPLVHDGRVAFLGSLDRRELSDSFYPGLDVLIVTSEMETGPLVAWEAMMHGVAILTSAYRGLRSEAFLRHNENALVFPVGQPRIAARLIAGTDADVNLLRSIGQHGLTTAKRELTHQIMIDRWMAALQQVVRTAPATAPANANAGAPPTSAREWLHDAVRRTLARPLAHGNAHEEWPRYRAGWVPLTQREAFAERLDSLEASLPTMHTSSHV